MSEFSSYAPGTASWIDVATTQGPHFYVMAGV
jgi:hypothetical protein